MSGIIEVMRRSNWEVTMKFNLTAISLAAGILWGLMVLLAGLIGTGSSAKSFF